MSSSRDWFLLVDLHLFKVLLQGHWGCRVRDVVYLVFNDLKVLVVGRGIWSWRNSPLIVGTITWCWFTSTLALVLLRDLWPRLVYGSMHLFFSLLTLFALLELLLLFLNVLLGDLIVLVKLEMDVFSLGLLTRSSWSGWLLLRLAGCLIGRRSWWLSFFGLLLSIVPSWCLVGCIWLFSQVILTIRLLFLLVHRFWLSLWLLGLASWNRVLLGARYSRLLLS